MVDLKRFFEFLSIPSISSEPEYAADVRRAANWVKNYLDEIGFQTELWETKRHPIIFAEKLVDPSLPTLLIYNHYDVQPVDPLELWESPPFSPVEKEGVIFARGAQDNKGQCFYVLEALKELSPHFPINLKLCIEGEEECGSESLYEALPLYAKKLKADYVAIVDLGIPNATTPAITLGTRGLVTFDLEVEGASTDMHSGSHGGIVYNPIHALVKMLAEARGEDGKVLIPGFYNGILPVSETEREQIDFAFDAAQYKTNFGTTPSGGEKAFSPLERAWLRPTLEINGISGGYTGAGFKTVIPAKAHAKLSCRLVPGQKPEEIGKKLEAFFLSKAPEGIHVKLSCHKGGGEAARSSPESACAKAFLKAYTDVFGSPCKCILEGASIPIIPELAKTSGALPVLVGLGLPTDKIHAPNEHFSVNRLKQGKEIIKKAIQHLRSSQ